MDKIKFIENEIHCVNFQITKINKDIAFLTENKRATTDLEKTIVVLTKRLQTLQQIKTDLEAWEVTKEELQIVFKGKNYYSEPLHRYELNVIGQNKIDTLNKALEVK